MRTTERTTGETRMPKAASKLFADESANLHHEVARIVADPEVWLQTPNTHLGGESPIHLMGTPQEQRLRDLLRAIKPTVSPAKNSLVYFISISYKDHPVWRS